VNSKGEWTTRSRTAQSSLLPQRGQFSQLQPGHACTFHFFNLHGTRESLKLPTSKYHIHPHKTQFFPNSLSKKWNRATGGVTL